MSSLRDQGGSAQLCSEGIQITNVHTALPMYWGFDREVGNACGDDRGKLGKIGWNRKWIGGDRKQIGEGRKQIGSRGMGS